MVENVADKKFYSIREIASEAQFSVNWVHQLIKKLGLKPEILPRGEAGHELILPKEEAMKLIRYATKRVKIEEKRKKL